MKRKILTPALLFLILLIFLGCSATSFNRGKYLYERGEYDEAVKNLEEAVRKSPRTLKYKALLERAKLQASSKHFTMAKMAIDKKDYQNALKDLQLAIIYDPSNQYAQDTMQNLLQLLAEEERKARAKVLTIEEMKKKANEESKPPMIDPKSNIPLVLKFNNAPLRTILDAISKASGINFIYDDKAEREKKISVDFSKVNLEQVLDYIMQQTKHFYKVLDPHTLIIVPDTKQKREEYEEQVMRTFYLSNADAKQVFQLLRTIVQARKMATNKDLNSITIKDSPETVALCEKIIEANDKSVGEVVVDVELLEVNSTKLKTLGIDLSSKSMTIAPESHIQKDDKGNPTGFGTGAPVPLGKIDAVYKGTLFAFPIPNIIVNFLQTDSDSQVLAKPQLRVMEGKKASVHIGDRVPIPTSSYVYPGNTTQTNYVPTTTYTYQDVGVKIEIEPRVHHNKEISLKITAEVSSVTGYVESSSALQAAQPIIGTRKVQTEIRLEDGESSLLAGLLREEDSNSFSGIPGVGSIPLLRRLFGNSNVNKKSTDVVLLLTPHIIRMPNITEDDMRNLWVGTEQNPKLRGYRGETSYMPSPFEGEEGSEPPEKLDDENQPDGSQERQKEEEKKSEKEANPNQNARILINPTTTSVVAGNSVTLSVVIVGVKDGKSAHFEAEFPTDILSFEGCEEGTFFKMGSSNTTFQASESPPGMVVANLGIAGDGSSSGSGLILKYKFKALHPGVARVTISSAQIFDSDGNSQTMGVISSVINIGGGSDKKDKP